jgi:hypothetical protein
LVRDDDLGGFGSRQTSGSPPSALSLLERVGFEGTALDAVSYVAVLGPVSTALDKAAAGRTIASTTRRTVAIVKVHQKYSFTHRTAKIQERRKSR